MSHEELRDALGAYADGELEAERRAALEAHLGVCAECRGELEALRELDRAIQSRAVPDPGPQYWARFADRVEERTQSHAPAEVASFYERLTSWLFPGERFAWARAAAAVAACTLLVTIGLHGFRSVETARQAPSETGLPPSVQTQQMQGTPPPAGGSEPGPVDIAQKSAELAEELAEERREPEGAPLQGTESTPPSPAGSTPVSAPSRAARPLPVPEPQREGAAAGEDFSRSFAKAAPEPAASKSGEGPSQDALAREKSSQEVATLGEPARDPASREAASGEVGPREAVERVEPLAAAPAAPTPSPPLAAKARDETAAAPSSEPGLSSKRVLAVRQPGVTKAPLQDVLDSLTSSSRVGRSDLHVRGGRVPYEITLAPVESLLARDARLWPRRDVPEERARLAELAKELAARSGDPRVRPRAIAYLEHLAATSPTDAERERWLEMLRPIEER